MAIKFNKTILEPDYPVVQTKAGKLRGFVADGVFNFRGVDYARADRFMLPKPLEPWDGIKNATDYGYTCLTINQNSPEGNFTIMHRYWPQSEDCLNLNIWTNSLDPAAKKAVMVWIHGGCYLDGSSIEMVAYDGDELARTGDVVVVTVNHRLNLLGYLDLSDFGEKYRYSGVAGMGDLVAALKWIQENIAQFGGDPDNVTIFGQSGGSSKVATLMQCPAADGLYHKAITQSGAPNAGPTVTKEGALALGAEIVDGLGLNKNNIDEILTMSYQDILKGAAKKGRTKFEDFMWQLCPSPDGDYYKGLFLDVGFRPEVKHVPMIIGSNMGEFGFKPNVASFGLKTDEEKRAALEQFYHEDTDELIRLFRRTYPDKDIALLSTTDDSVRLKVEKFARMRAAQADAPVYNYMLSYVFPFNGGTTAWHCAEIPFVFRNTQLELSHVSGGPEEALKLEAAISGSWLAFAKTGDPNCAEIPEWTPYSEACPATMFFDSPACTVDVARDTELMKLLMSKAWSPHRPDAD